MSPFFWILWLFAVLLQARCGAAVWIGNYSISERESFRPHPEGTSSKSNVRIRRRLSDYEQYLQEKKIWDILIPNNTYQFGKPDMFVEKVPWLEALLTLHDRGY